VTTSSLPDNRAALRLPEFRYLLSAVAFGTLASRALAVVIGYQIYEITRDPLALGWLGLVEAIPSLSLALFGGHFADRHDRRKIVLVTQGISILCALIFAALSMGAAKPSVYALYAVIFLAGIARGFSGPASGAFEAQVVPRELQVGSATYLSSVWTGCSIIGPALAGFSYDLLGTYKTYLLLAGLFSLSLISVSRIAPKPVPPAIEGESIWESIAIGIRYVFSTPALVGSMALDLFAVLFGGAMALLPIFAHDILHVGARGLGFLTAAPSAGALLASLAATRFPPGKNAGRNLILCVAAFGVSMIIFANSTNFYLTLTALFFSGVFDGISVVIRSAILRLYSPEPLRGRINAVSMIFIGSSNEIGAFESGVTARLLGTERSVWLGGVVTLLVVGITAAISPSLRRLSLDAQPIDMQNEKNEL